MSRDYMKEAIFTRVPTVIKKRFMIKCIKTQKTQEEVITDLLTEWVNSPLLKK